MIIMEENLLYCGPLAKIIYKSLETRFHHLFDDRNHILASISNPAFKTRFLKLQTDKDRAIRYLREEVNALNKNNTPSTSNPEKEKKSSKQTSSLVHFDDDIIMNPIKDEVDEYLKDLGEGSRELTSLKKFPTVLKVFRNKNTIQCSSGMSEINK